MGTSGISTEEKWRCRGRGGAPGQHPARPNHCRRMNPEPAQRPPIYKRHRGAQAAHRKGEFWSISGPCKTRVACPHQKVKELHTNSAPLTPAPRLLAFPVVWARGGHGSTATRIFTFSVAPLQAVEPAHPQRGRVRRRPSVDPQSSSFRPPRSLI